MPSLVASIALDKRNSLCSKVALVRSSVLDLRETSTTNEQKDDRDDGEASRFLNVGDARLGEVIQHVLLARRYLPAPPADMGNF